jgi:hypothetical protein
MALQHPRWRGYPPGMGVEAIAHRSSMSTGRGRKTESAAAFSDEARAPVAGGGPASGWRERELGSTFHRRKSGKRGLGFRSPGKSSRRRRRPDSDGGALGQRWSAPDTDDGAVRMSTREARRGEATVRLGQRGGAVGTPVRGPDRRADRRGRRGTRWVTDGPHMSVISELNFTPRRK